MVSFFLVCAWVTFCNFCFCGFVFNIEFSIANKSDYPLAGLLTRYTLTPIETENTPNGGAPSSPGGSEYVFDRWLQAAPTRVLTLPWAFRSSASPWTPLGMAPPGESHGWDGAAAPLPRLTRRGDQLSSHRQASIWEYVPATLTSGSGGREILPRKYSTAASSVTPTRARNQCW